MMQSGASIADRGYQHYEGARQGTLHALWTIALAAAKRGMGIRRPVRTKIMPWLLFAVPYIVVTYVLALKIIGIVPRGTELALAGPLYAAVYTLISQPVLLFTALVAPDILCPDRRERVLSLYFVAPITRVQYVAAKLAGVAGLLLLMTVVPALVLFFGGALLEHDALGFLRGHLGDVWRLVLAGLVVTLYDAAVAMAVAAFNDRRAYAGGIFVGLMVVSGVAAGILSAAMHFTHHQWFALLSLISLPFQVMRWIFGQPLDPHLDGWAYAGATLIVSGVALALIVWQYQRVRE